MTQNPSIRDLLSNHLGEIRNPATVDLSGNHTEDPGQPPALNGPELKQSILQAIGQAGAQSDPASQAQFENDAFRQKVVEALTVNINNQDGK